MTTDRPHDPSPDLSHERPAQGYQALHSLLMSLDTVTEFLQELADLATTVMPGSLSCGITTRYDGRPLTVSSNNALAQSLDETQYQAWQGPCLTAMDTGEVVSVVDLEHEVRWPSYIATARRHGLRSSLSVPLIVDNQSVGAINLYSTTTTHAFDDRSRSRAEIFAAQASTALLLSTRQAKTTAVNEQLESALTSRSEIDQAMGIVMAQQQCTPEHAFGLLRSHSQNTNRPLRQVAADLVRRTSRTERDPHRPS
ncbi:MAG: GAF and ANTAR domain-containing protein [Ornithinimicrobium sp.]